jgi:hypothetical protein
MNKNKIHAAIMALAAFTLPPCLVQAQDTSRNYVRTVTMLDADGTDSLVTVRQVREANCNNTPFHRSSDILFSFVK